MSEHIEKQQPLICSPYEVNDQRHSFTQMLVSFCGRLSIRRGGNIYAYRLIDMSRHKSVSLLGQFHPNKSLQLCGKQSELHPALVQCVCKANSAI